MNKLVKPLIAIAAVILISSMVARIATGSPTLEEYAQENPEIAYATPEPQPIKTPLPEATPVSDATSASKATPALDVTPSPDAAPAPEAAASEFSQSEAPTSDSGITVYQEGFSYGPLTDEVKARITGISYPVAESVAPALAVEAVNLISDDQIPAISYDDLCYMNVLYYDFNGEIQTGELICNNKLAQDFVEIFYELYLNEYQIEKIRLVDEYGGDDTASMLDNNTSCFNYRVVDGSTSLSKHAMGCAIDINPFYNPYVVFNKNGSGETYISPEGSEIYADRSQNFPYKIDENDLCYKLFKEHGFTWGGDWNSCKDYQHFQKVID